MSKRDFVRRYEENEFGNRSPTWNTLAEFIKAEYYGLVHLRNRVAGGPTWYDVPAIDVIPKFDRITRMGLVKGSDIYFSAMAPTEKTLIQGELMQTEEGLYLYYTNVAKPMRDALKEHSVNSYGVYASQLLQHYMDPASWEWINVLLERYPGHVTEFSTYSVNWGTIPGRNTIVWEVRAY